MTRVDAIVVGAGIVGLAHAVHLARAGRSVLVLERADRAEGASVRNFGMVWPIGQTAGIQFRRALRGRELWLELAGWAGFWYSRCGSLHIARHEDELAVLREFADSASPDHRIELLDPECAIGRCPGLKRAGLLGALWSDTELAIDARETIAAITSWLSSLEGVEIRFGTSVRRIDSGHVETTAGSCFEADAVVVCPGDDTRSLFPELFESAPVRRCKLQMMRTVPQPGGWRLGVHLAGGLTLRHYAAFAHCPTLPVLAARIATETPAFDRYGIHVLASQNGAGELFIGDSHEYGHNTGLGTSGEIERLILGYLGDMLEVPRVEIAERWFGSYLKIDAPDGVIIKSPYANVRVITGVGGAGMTLALAFAEEICRDLGMA